MQGVVVYLNVGDDLSAVLARPNLAVVCDAEQIACASLDKTNNYRKEYLSGSIEKPMARLIER
jgi:hypothetical protein